MSSELSFEDALERLDAIVLEVKRDDVSLDKSLELLEEGVRLANACTEKTDHSYWREELEDRA